MSEVSVKRNVKATVFQMLFSEKKELLELYNALNQSAYTNEEDFTVTTLDNAVYLSMKNDISFIFQYNLYLYEHQSTINPNIPLRNLFYLSDLLQGLTAEKNIYGSHLITIPEPRFVVFYNGEEEQPDRVEYRLSQMYEKHSNDPDIELRVLVLNINENHNTEILKACHTLKDYSKFVQKIRSNKKTMPISKAAEKAVDDCIKEGILKEFLIKHKAEATNMSIYEYDAEQHERFLREEGREEGRAEEHVNTLREAARADKAEQDIIRLRAEIESLKAQSLEHNTETTNSSIYNYDAKQHERFLREEGRAEEHVNTLREAARADKAEQDVNRLRAEIESLKAQLIELTAHKKS